MQTILLIRGKGAEIITQDEKITQEGQLEACNWLKHPATPSKHPSAPFKQMIQAVQTIHTTQAIWIIWTLQNLKPVQIDLFKSRHGYMFRHGSMFSITFSFFSRLVEQHGHN